MYEVRNIFTDASVTVPVVLTFGDVLWSNEKYVEREKLTDGVCIIYL